MSSTSDEILTLSEVANRLRVSHDHLRRLIASGELTPTFLVGHARRFSWSDVCSQLQPLIREASTAQAGEPVVAA